MTTQPKGLVSEVAMRRYSTRDEQLVPSSRTAKASAVPDQDADNLLVPIVLLNDDPRPVAFSSYGDLSDVSNTSNMAIRSVSRSSEDCGHTDHTLTDGGDSNGLGGNPFRAIIVGGGPTGLATAHALNHAGIDWILLDQRPEITTAVSSPLILWPHTSRVLDQLGLLDEAITGSFTMFTKSNLRSDGTERETTEVARLLADNHGHPWVPISRANLIETLYKNLEGRDQRVLTNKAVTAVESHNTSVRVTCADASVVDGSIVIGSDGARSTVREIMNQLRAEKAAQWQRDRRSPFARCLGFGRGVFPRSSTTPQQKRTMKANFYGLIGCAPLIDGLEPHAMSETRARNGVGIAVLSGVDVAYFQVYLKLEKNNGERRPRGGEEPPYTDEDADALAAELAEHPLTTSVRFGDVWGSRHWGAVVDYEEGVADEWHHERVVLLGDSAHAFTPSAGLALNAAWQDMVDLTNRLRAMVVGVPRPQHRGRGQQRRRPGTEQVEKVFKAYQRSREGPAKAAKRFSAGVTRRVTRAGPVYRFVDWMLPVLGGDAMVLTRMFGWFFKQGLVLDFVPEREFDEDWVRWVHGCARGDDGGGGKKENREERMVRLLRGEAEFL